MVKNVVRYGRVSVKRFSVFVDVPGGIEVERGPVESVKDDSNDCTESERQNDSQRPKINRQSPVVEAKDKSRPWRLSIFILPVLLGS